MLAIQASFVSRARRTHTAEERLDSAENLSASLVILFVVRTFFVSVMPAHLIFSKLTMTMANTKNYKGLKLLFHS